MDSRNAIVDQRLGLNAYWAATGSRANFALDSAFVFGTSGDGYAYRYFCPVASPIVALYMMIDTSAGTYANITCACDIRNENSAQATRPGSTVRESSSGFTLAAAVDQWSKFTFTGSYSPAVGEVLWPTIRNTSASPTVDFPSVLTHGTAALGRSPVTRIIQGFTNTAGFSTNGTATSSPVIVIEHSNGEVFGCPFTIFSSTFYTSNTRKRGIRTPVLTVTREVVGFGFTASTALSGIEVFEGNAGPGTTPLASYALGTDSNEIIDEAVGVKWIDTPLILKRGHSYRIVLTFGSSSQLPTVMQIQDYSSYSAVFDKCFEAPDICYSTVDDGAGGWTDSKAGSPVVCTIESRVIVPSGYIGG